MRLSNFLPLAVLVVAASLGTARPIDNNDVV